jgi:hypothetical protein
MNCFPAVSIYSFTKMIFYLILFSDSSVRAAATTAAASVDGDG